MRDRFLAGRVQDPVRPDERCDPCRCLEQEGRFPDPGLATEEHDRTRDEPTTEDAIELADASGDPGSLRFPHVDQPGGTRRRPTAVPADEAGLGSWLAPDLRLHEAVPGRAGAALTFPAQKGFAAGLADEASVRAPRHLAHRQPSRRPMVRLRPGSAARTRECRGRLPGRGPPRSSCPARTCRAGGARRGRPRPCSG